MHTTADGPARAVPLAARARARAARAGGVRSGPRSWGVLGALVAVNLLIGGLGGASTQGAVDGWYADAQKVAWNPPNGVFGPVWSFLYVSMAVAAWLVWRRSGFADAKGAWTLYGAQLALNAAWTPVFFNGRLPWVALAIIVALAVLIAATIAAFRRHSTPAAWLLVPYLAWVAYATTLNAGIAVLN